MKLITNINIDKSELPSTSSVRNMSIQGEDGASFLLQIFNSSQQFYNFHTKSFSSTISSESVDQVTISGSSYSKNISFPANGSGDTYTFLIIARIEKETMFSSGSSHSQSFVITQVQDATLTFTVATSNTSNYTSWDSNDNITSTGKPGITNPITKTLDWTLTNTSNNTYGFGLRLTRQPVDTDWYYSTTDTVNGSTSSSSQVTVDDLTDICTGMYVTAVSSGSLSGTPLIKEINRTTKTLTLSSAQSFSDGITLTFQARGSAVINKSINANIDFSNFVSTTTSARAAELSKTVRTTATGNTTIPLNGTFGISGGGHVTVSGRGIINTSANTVQTVDPDEVAGSVVVQVNQSVKQGTKLYFTGSTQSIDIDNSFIIKSHPRSNKTIYLNLDNFITPGSTP
tara:strand:- start:665 stop:1864 length:1200 start_codon:yes stop_codon:yes gene_type:complete